MKIVAMSDLHGILPPPKGIPACDTLIVAGDVCPSWDHTIPYQRSWLESNFAEWLRSLPAKHIIGIGGNHDYALEYSEALARRLPWTYLLDESVTISGVSFYGLPWVPNLSLWAFHLDDVRLDEKYNAVPVGTDFVVSHGPPLGYCDKTVAKFGSQNAGAPSAIDMLDRVSPCAFICGHIHESYGHMMRNQTHVMNVSHMTEHYEPRNPPASIVLADGVLWHDLRMSSLTEDDFWKAAY